MAYRILQKDLDILRQSNKEMYVKLELLNLDLRVLDSLEGNLISDSFSINADSDIRRTYSCELFIDNYNNFITSADKKIWINRYIRPYLGIKYQRTNEVIWYPIGTFVFNTMDYSYDVTSKKLSLTCSDLMATLNGDRGGIIQGQKNVVEQGTTIYSAITGTLVDAGIKKYLVEDIGRIVPYDLEFSVGAKYYDILKQLVELYAGYEMFFDLDGVFIVQSIPSGKSEPVLLDNDIIDPLVINEQSNSSFNNIYNVTEIWGKSLEADRYIESTSTSNSHDYIIDYPLVTGETSFALENFTKYAFKILTTNTNSVQININGTGQKHLYEDNTTADNIEYSELADGRLQAGSVYVVKYRKASDDFILLGQFQAYGIYKCEDGECPFSTINLGYELRQVLSFEELYSDSLCQQRAKYETWLATRFQDSINLTMVSIPFLDVNWKISYTTQKTQEVNEYIIKSISGSNSSATINVSMITYTPLYPDII